MNKKRTLANELVPGSITHPGALLKKELEAREMKQIDLARQIGIAKNVMSELINEKRNITPDLAIKLEAALDIKAEFWMKYQVTYEIDKIRITRHNSIQKASISTKAKRQLASTK